MLRASAMVGFARFRGNALRGWKGPAAVFCVIPNEILTVDQEKTSPKTARLLKRLRKIEQLPPANQRAVVKMVGALVTARERSS